MMSTSDVTPSMATTVTDSHDQDDHDSGAMSEQT